MFFLFLHLYSLFICIQNLLKCDWLAPRLKLTRKTETRKIEEISPDKTAVVPLLLTALGLVGCNKESWIMSVTSFFFFPADPCQATAVQKLILLQFIKNVNFSYPHKGKAANKVISPQV